MTGKYQVFYDEQCEICQAGGSWLRILDVDKVIDLVPIQEETITGQTFGMDEALAQLHVIAPDDTVYKGREAVTELACLFRETRWIGKFFSSGLRARLADKLYSFVASNRYALSKCRGGNCRVARQAYQDAAAPFWTCYATGSLIKLPLSVTAYFKGIHKNWSIYFNTKNRRLDFLDGTLNMLFLNDFPSDLVPILFGERFTTLIYDGVAIDPGGTKMRAAVERWLKDSIEITSVAVTHHHEEHVGNAQWLAEKLGVDLWISKETSKLLSPPEKLPWSRAFIIGQPEELHGKLNFLHDELKTRSGILKILKTPGHCDDELSFYDPERKVLLAGDSFMGTYFSTPNPEVDSTRWIDSLEAVLKLDIEILVEAHGHVHTLRKDFPDIEGVVIRRDPRKQLEEKLEYLYWLKDQIKEGFDEGLPIRAVEASCFPWVSKKNWETFIHDEIVRMLTEGDFSRTKVINSFMRRRDKDEIWPSNNQVMFICEKKR